VRRWNKLRRGRYSNTGTAGLKGYAMQTQTTECREINFTLQGTAD